MSPYFYARLAAMVVVAIGLVFVVGNATNQPTVRSITRTLQKSVQKTISSNSGPRSVTCDAFLEYLVAHELTAHPGVPRPVTGTAVAAGYRRYSSSPDYYDYILPTPIRTIMQPREFATPMQVFAGWNRQLIAVRTIGHGVYARRFGKDAFAVVESLKSAGYLPKSLRFSEVTIRETNVDPFRLHLVGKVGDATVEAAIYPQSRRSQGVMVMYPTATANRAAIDRVINGLQANAGRGPETSDGGFGFDPLKAPRVRLTGNGPLQTIEASSNERGGFFVEGFMTESTASPIEESSRDAVAVGSDPTPRIRVTAAEQDHESSHAERTGNAYLYEATRNGNHASITYGQIAPGQSVSMSSYRDALQVLTTNGTWIETENGLESVGTVNAVHFPIGMPENADVAVTFDWPDSSDGSRFCAGVLLKSGQYVVLVLDCDRNGQVTSTFAAKGGLVPSDTSGVPVRLRETNALVLELRGESVTARVNSQPAGAAGSHNLLDVREVRRILRTNQQSLILQAAGSEVTIRDWTVTGVE